LIDLVKLKESIDELGCFDFDYKQNKYDY